MSRGVDSGSIEQDGARCRRSGETAAADFAELRGPDQDHAGVRRAIEANYGISGLWADRKVVPGILATPNDQSYDRNVGTGEANRISDCEKAQTSPASSLI